MLHTFVLIFLLFLIYFINKNWNYELTLEKNNIIYDFLPYIRSTIFGIIDSSSMFLFENAYMGFLMYIFQNTTISILWIGALSAAYAIFISQNIHQIINKTFNDIYDPQPYQDAIGIFIGLFIVLLFYKISKYQMLLL